MKLLEQAEGAQGVETEQSPMNRSFQPGRPARLIRIFASSFLVLTLFGSGIGCGSDFPEQSEITNLRFLSVQAEPPWIRPSKTSSITALVVGLQPGRRLSYRWSWCPLRGPNSFQFECLVTPELISEITGVQVDETIYDLGTSSTAEFNYAFSPDDVRATCEEIRSLDTASSLVTLPECDGTFPISIRLDASDGDRRITAFKSLRLIYQEDASQPRDQANPHIDDLGVEVLFNGRTVTGPLGFETKYTVRLGPDPSGTPLDQLDRLSETFTESQTNTETREQLILSWFASTGEYDDNRSGFLPDTIQTPDRPDGIPINEAWDSARTNGWTSPRRADFSSGQSTTLYVVIRDDRLGTSWTSTTVVIGEARP